MCDRENVEDRSLTDQQGCGALYEVLEQCLGEHERDWRRCQEELVAFRRCYARFQGRRAAAQQEQAGGAATGQPGGDGR
jgi:hypothetical protein